MMPTKNGSVLVIPCSGIGKAFGSVGREAMYLITEEMRPDATETVCLSLLTLGDEEAQELVRTHPVLTIDGCPKHCAVASVQAAGAEPAATYRVFDVFRRHRDLRVREIADIGENGRRMAEILAGDVVAEIDRILEE